MMHAAADDEPFIKVTEYYDANGVLIESTSATYNPDHLPPERLQTVVVRLIEDVTVFGEHLGWHPHTHEQLTRPRTDTSAGDFRYRRRWLDRARGALGV